MYPSWCCKCSGTLVIRCFSLLLVLTWTIGSIVHWISSTNYAEFRPFPWFCFLKNYCLSAFSILLFNMLPPFESLSWVLTWWGCNSLFVQHFQKIICKSPVISMRILRLELHMFQYYKQLYIFLFTVETRAQNKSLQKRGTEEMQTCFGPSVIVTHLCALLY